MNKMFVFPGYGSQLVGMFNALPQEVNIVRLTDAAEARSGLDIVKVVEEGPDSALSDVRIAYPAIVINDAAWGKYLEVSGVEPTVVCGYGIGDVAALSAAGVISMGAAVTLANILARTYVHTSADSDGVMQTIVGIDAETVGEVLKGTSHVWISAVNSPRQVVVSGVASAVDALGPAFENAGARRVMKVNVPGALNSPLMAQAQEQIAAYLDNADFREATVPYLSCVDGQMYTDGAKIKEKFIESITSPIQFQKAVSTALNEFDVKIALECGAGSLLCGHLAHADLAAIPVTQYSDENGIELLKNRIQSIETRA